MWPYILVAPLRDTDPQNANDLQFDLSVSLKVKSNGTISLSIYNSYVYLSPLTCYIRIIKYCGIMELTCFNLVHHNVSIFQPGSTINYRSYTYCVQIEIYLVQLGVGFNCQPVTIMVYCVR